MSYNSGCDLLEELLKIKSWSISGVVDFREESEDKLIFVVKAKSAGSHENVSNVGPPLPRVSIKWEESMELSNVIWREDWIFGGNVFCEDGFELFFLDFSLGHDRYFQYNKL